LSPQKGAQRLARQYGVGAAHAGGFVTAEEGVFAGQGHYFVHVPRQVQAGVPLHHAVEVYRVHGQFNALVADVADVALDAAEAGGEGNGFAEKELAGVVVVHVHREAEPAVPERAVHPQVYFAGVFPLQVVVAQAGRAGPEAPL
jgi:hypothetical protein